MIQPLLVKRIDRKRFDVLVGISRRPTASLFSEELEWYSNEEESILGVVLLDTTDNDYVGLLLSRDEGGCFRAFDLETSIGMLERARSWVHNAIKWHTGSGYNSHVSGAGRRGVDLFTPVVPADKLHPSFLLLCRDPAYTPARAVIREIMPHYVDIDGNFVEQFQTTGFDSRLWELYLFRYLNEENLWLNSEHSTPDFLVETGNTTIAIEAVIVGRRAENPVSVVKPERPPMSFLLRADSTDAMAIKFGSPLFTKLSKEYWKLPHVAGNPLVFAIADFHEDQSMLWSSTALISYLYGIHHEVTIGPRGPIVSASRLTTHTVGNKTIPSGYFFQPGAEHVSGVLFSLSGTLSKFNRIGRQAGFCDPSVVMIRSGACHDHTPDAIAPKPFRYVVDEGANETWSEGLSLFHNPRAIHPVPESCFPSIAHHQYRDESLVSLVPDFHPYASITMTFKFPRGFDARSELGAANRR